jgi:non-specific serine/threonine protein kinase
VDGLIALVDKSLIRQEPDASGGSRYLMLEMVWEFAVEQLESTHDDLAIRQRHAAFYTARAEEAHPWLTMREAQPRVSASTAPMWVERLESDQENLRRALAWLAESGQWVDCLRLTVLLCPFWDVRGYLAEGRTWLERGLTRVRPDDVPPGRRAEAMANLGLFVLRLGEHDRAEALLDEAHGIWIESGDTTSRAWLHMILGGVAEYREDEVRAQWWYEQALAGFRVEGNVAGISETLNNLADTAYRRADLAEAERLADEALAVGRTASMPAHISAALVTVGAIASARKTWDRAIAAHREALSLSHVAAHQLNMADAITGLAEVAAGTGDPQRAARLLGAVDAMAEVLGVPRLAHQALHRRAMAATRANLDPATLAAAVAAGRLLSQAAVMAECERVTGASTGPAPDRFTRREIEVLRLLVAGYTDRSIGEALFIGTRTVESHVGRILAKLGVRTRSAAVTAALTAGLVDPPPAGSLAEEE